MAPVPKFILPWKPAESAEERDIGPSRVIAIMGIIRGQPVAYRNEVLPPNITARISIEAGVPLGWERYVGLNGITIGISRFGASAPGNIVYEKLGLTVGRVVDEALKLTRKAITS